jgi:hypothetical protein
VKGGQENEDDVMNSNNSLGKSFTTERNKKGNGTTVEHIGFGIF